MMQWYVLRRNGGLGNNGGGEGDSPMPANAAALFVMCRVSPKTLLTFCTNGVLLRTLMGGSGPLATVTHVIVVSMHRDIRASQHSHTCYYGWYMPRERERELAGKLVRSEVALLLLCRQQTYSRLILSTSQFILLLVIVCCMSMMK